MNRYVRILSVVATLVVTSSLPPFAMPAAAADEIEILGEGDLLAFAANLSVDPSFYDGDTVVLKDDITLTGNWIPVNAVGLVFDGGGHTISGLYVEDYIGYDGTSPWTQCAGLFGVLDLATVKDLTLESPVISIRDDYAWDDPFAIGAIAGLTYGAQIRNVSIDNPAICLENAWATAFVGGIAGFTKSSAELNSMGLHITLINGAEMYGGKVSIESFDYDCGDTMVYLGGIVGANYQGLVANTAVYGVETAVGSPATRHIDTICAGGTVGYTSAIAEPSHGSSTACLFNNIAMPEVTLHANVTADDISIGGVCGFLNVDSVVNNLYIGDPGYPVFGKTDSAVGYTVSHNYSYASASIALADGIIAKLNDTSPGVGGLYTVAAVTNADAAGNPLYATIEDCLARCKTWIKRGDVAAVGEDVPGFGAYWSHTPPGGTIPPSYGPGSPTPPSGGASVVFVDGVETSAGEVSVGDDKTIVTVNQDVLNAEIENANKNVTVVIPTGTDAAEAVLVVKNLDDLAERDMSLTIVVGNTQYEIPGAAIDTAAIMAALGVDDPTQVPFCVTIVSNLGAEAMAMVEAAVDQSGWLLVLPPMEFTLTASYGGQSVEISGFTQFVKRTVEITEEEAGKITTAVVIDPDGTTRHVPTRVYFENGKWYAEINSLTNSTYALVFSTAVFADSAGKWYEAAVNEMGSRGVIAGIGNNLYAGGRDITRAEFAALIVRALGLQAKTGDPTIFQDIPAGAWYAGAVGKAYEYGLVSGIGGGLYAPDGPITRQEAMVVVRRAAKLAGFSGFEGSIEGFPDAGSVCVWALDAVRWSVGSSLVEGSGGMLRPTENTTRAAAVVLVLRLLREAGLVGSIET